MLERLGYSVMSTTSSVEALDLFRDGSGQFDLVITDLTMPKMTGEQLAAELTRIRRDIPIIICTDTAAPWPRAGRRSTAFAR